MYAVYEQTFPTTPKRRVMDVEFASLDEAVDYFVQLGSFIEIDPDGHDAADVFTTGGLVLTVEPMRA